MPQFVEYFMVCGLDAKSLEKESASSSGERERGISARCSQRGARGLLRHKRTIFTMREELQLRRLL